MLSIRSSIGALLRYLEPLVQPLEAIRALREYPRFWVQRRDYQRLPKAPRLRWTEDYPQLLDATSTTGFEPHYTFQDGWAAREIATLDPTRHVDVGSRISLVIGLAAWLPVTFVDLRPLEIDLSGLEIVEGSILALPFGDQTLTSVSCLHVAEHIGLGRYGDNLNPVGTALAAQELQRVMAPGGQLLFSLPVGRPRTQFNAHRIHDPALVPGLFPELRLDGFAGVDDRGRFSPTLAPDDLSGAQWSCGLYRFVRD